MLACDQVITVVRLVSGEQYELIVFEGVSWYNKTRIKTEGAGVVYDNAVQIRIPAGAITTQPLPRVGDHVFPGRLGPGESILRAADLAARGARKIVAVGDNRRGGLPHVGGIGQ